jgi:hypothetical protein
LNSPVISFRAVCDKRSSSANKSKDWACARKCASSCALPSPGPHPPLWPPPPPCSPGEGRRCSCWGEGAEGCACWDNMRRLPRSRHSPVRESSIGTMLRGCTGSASTCDERPQ